MRYRNAFRLAMENFASVYKLLLYRFITGVVFFSLTFVTLRLGLHSIIRSAEANTLTALLKDFVHAIATGDVERLQVFQTDFHEAILAFGDLLLAKIGGIVGSVIGVCVIYLVSRFVNGLGVFAFAQIDEDRMSTCSRTRFPTAYFKSMGKGALYQLAYVPLSFVYDVLAVLACWFFFFYLPSFLPAWGIVTTLIAISITLTAYICLQALKMTFISAWMPAMLDGQSLKKAMRTSILSRKGFGKRFSGYLVTLYLLFAVNFALAIFTFGGALLLSVPFSFLLLLNIQFVHYYEDNGKKYFISYNEIAGGNDTENLEQSSKNLEE